MFNSCIILFDRSKKTSFTPPRRLSDHQIRKDNLTTERKRNIISSLKTSVIVTFALIVIMAGDIYAQSFRNTGGVYKGSGLFRVKNQATGLPDTVSGTFEYFGGNQLVGAKNYENLLLTGDSTKSTNDVNILKSVAVADGVRLQVGSTMTLEKLNGRITNEAGVIIGRVTKSVDLINVPDSSDFGGIGLTISSKGSALGTTSINRVSGPAGVVNHNGKTSIQRSYSVSPANTIGNDGNIYFRYSKDELGGNDSLTLDIWRSPDGFNWRRQHTLRNGNELIRTGKFMSGSWTAADANHLLGRSNYEFDPDSVLAVGSDSLRGRTGHTLDSLFVAQITDIYGNIIAGTQVRFKITGLPDTSTAGQSLSDTLVLTDSQGRVSTRLRLGNKVGRYTVSAQVISIPTAKINFYGYASSGIYAFRTITAPPTDSIKQIVGPFTIVALDEFNTSVSYTGLRFTISPPAGKNPIKQKVTQADTVTDANGNAHVTIQLGEKVGTYTIEARSTENDSIFIRIPIQATHGIPALAWQRGLTVLSDTIGKTLPKFIYAITDRDTNVVGGHNISFSIVSKPAGSTGDSLVNPIAMTDTNTGEASIALKLGDKVGDYIVRIEDATIANSARFDTGRAIHGSARILAYLQGRNQNKRILNVLDTAFTVRINDVGGNPVSHVPVQFAITGTPAGAWGQALTNVIDTTDSFGNARTYLKLGSKIGGYVINASSPTITSTNIQFNATALVGIANKVAQQSGNIQVGQIGDRLNPFIVQISDTGGNLVPNTQVNFSVINRPPFAGMDSLTASTSLTDTAGRASSNLILGNKQGQYTVRASVGNNKDTMFVAYAIMLLADVNHDSHRNIADLTAIIDHVIGKRILTGFDLSKADMYPVRSDGTIGDGVVDIRDAQVCLDSLLASGWDPTRDWMLTPELFLSNIPASAMLADTGAPMLASATDSCYIQMTYIGSRFSLKNTTPVKGLQAKIYMKNSVKVDTMDVIFPRANMMKSMVRSIGKEIDVLMWNYSNTPIDIGDSPIFRLPVQLSDNNVDSIHVIVSTTDSNAATLIASTKQDVRNSIPQDWKLYQNYPNPFNPSTTIEFDVPEVNGKIPRAAIQIFNILGQKVMTIERGVYEAGRYKVTWNGTNEGGTKVASGVYFYRLLAGDHVSTKKMVMIK